MPIIDRDRIIYLIQRVRNGQASSEERRELERFSEWAHQDESLFDFLTEEETESLRRIMFDSIDSRIDQLEDSQPRTHFSRAVSFWPLRIAASLSLLAVISFILYWSDGDNLINVVSEYGQQVRVLLPDSSEVILNGNSAIQYAHSWNSDEDRVVWMEGEAFFDVTHTESNQRFVVRTQGNLKVQVLGTKFNVKVRRAVAQVMLEEGKVRVNVRDGKATDGLILKPGEMATLSDAQLTKERVNPLLYSGWREKKFYFDETPLRDVMLMLEDTYGYRVTFEDERLASRRLSGLIYSDRGADILTAITESFGIDISVSGKDVTIHGLPE